MISDAEFDLQQRHEHHANKVKYQSKQQVHITEAFDIFKDDLYAICMDKINNNEARVQFQSLLWDFKKWRSNPDDLTAAKIRAKAFPLPLLMQRYGLPVRFGFVHCPLHVGDRAGSLKLYPNNTWHCFGCGEGTDSIDFVMKYQKINFPQAIKALN